MKRHRSLSFQGWRNQFVRALAFGLLAAQLGGVLHAADLDEHSDGASCQLCHAYERIDAAPPTALVETELAKTEHGLPVTASTSAIPARYRTLPQTRAPPY